MEEFYFTVIVPVYNAEKYLNNCLDSIVNQSYKGKYEIIVVNDGSKDKSISIINEYKNNYNNIRIIDRENKGVLYSRVEAVKQALGKYIIFVDADDYLPYDALQIYYMNLLDTDYDILRGNYSNFDDNNNVKECRNFKESFIINKSQIGKKLYEEFLKSIKFNSLWREAIKKDIISLDEIDTSVSMGDDMFFNQACFKNINTMKIITDNLYFYRLNNQSMTHDYSVERLRKNIMDLNKVYDYIIKNIQEMNDLELLKLSYCSYLKTMNAYNFILIKNCKDKKIINENIDFIMNNKKNLEAKELIKFKDIKFKYKKLFIYLILKRKKIIYINLVKIVSKFIKL